MVTGHVNKGPGKHNHFNVSMYLIQFFETYIFANKFWQVLQKYRFQILFSE